MFNHTFGWAHASKSDVPVVDYNYVFGFGVQVERIDPHTHVHRPVVSADLSRIAELVRPKYPRVSDLSGEKKANEQERRD